MHSSPCSNISMETDDNDTLTFVSLGALIRALVHRMRPRQRPASGPTSPCPSSVRRSAINKHATTTMSVSAMSAPRNDGKEKRVSR